MKTITLDDLIQGLQKSASEEENKDEGKDKGEAEGNKGSTFPPKAEDKSKDEKTEDKDKFKEKDEQEKSAAFKAGADLVKEIMEKVASKNQQPINQTTDKGNEKMNKQAEAAGKALAQALLSKQAGVGDVATYNGIPAGVVANKVQEDNAAMKDQHDMVIQNLPGTDGRGEGGTVNEIYDAIVADAMSQGVKDQLVTGQTAQAEGAANARQVPAQIPVAGPEDLGENQEKLAAVIALMNEGIDFDDATSLVKAASDELEAEYDTQVKQAAFNDLIDNGVDFDVAMSLVKQASKMEAIKGAVGKAYGAAHAYGRAGVETVKATGANVARKAGDAYGKAHAYGRAGVETVKATGANMAQRGREAATQAQTLGYMVRDHAKAHPVGYGVAGAAGLAAAGGGAYAYGQHKKAAVNALIQDGVDFDTALSLVESKASQLYGA